MDFTEFEQHIKMRCAQILSEDYKACDLTLAEVVEDMYYTMMDHVYGKDPLEF